jgi:hypothetical protein
MWTARTSKPARGRKLCIFLQRVQSGCEVQQASYSLAALRSILGVIRPGTWWPLNPSCEEVKNEWSWSSLSPIRRQGVDGDKLFYGMVLFISGYGSVAVPMNMVIKSEVSWNAKSLLSTDSSELGSSYIPGYQVQVEFCGSRNWLHIYGLTLHLHKGVQLKPKLQHTRLTGLSITGVPLPSFSTCYLPALFLRNFLPIALSFPQGEQNGVLFQENCYFSSVAFFPRLCKSEIVSPVMNDSALRS